MEQFIQSYGALIIAIIIQSITFIIYTVRNNTRHELNFSQLTERLNDHIKNNDKEVKEMKEAFGNENTLTNVKLDKIDTKLTEICLSFAKLTGYLERFKEEKEG